jgi:hypothetical protein
MFNVATCFDSKVHFHGSRINCLKWNLIIIRSEMSSLIFFLILIFLFVPKTRSTAPETHAIFATLRQVTTVQSTHILTQTFILSECYYILHYYLKITSQCIMHYVKLLNRDRNSEHNYNCGHLYLYILYHRPRRWLSDIETCCNIKYITYSTCFEGI